MQDEEKRFREKFARLSKCYKERAQKLNAELQEELRTSTDKLKTVEQFALRHGMGPARGYENFYKKSD